VDKTGTDDAISYVFQWGFEVGKSSVIAARAYDTPKGKMLVATSLQNRTADMLKYVEKKNQELLDKHAAQVAKVMQ
jgi:hypothetical protein